MNEPSQRIVLGDGVWGKATSADPQYLLYPSTRWISSQGWGANWQLDLYLREPTISGQLGIPVTATVLTEEDVPTTWVTPFNWSDIVIAVNIDSPSVVGSSERVNCISTCIVSDTGHHNQSCRLAIQ
ncbi:uncharacterized protein ARMOST_17017 [Armillaria ostoyae]|uniref:Uncharacterized protein n=1 Tax=Armillaria ostoyae TaxID=47428 RepID=A0A284RXW5_ARMOS|nr:uncharacterized protein ARMOST_17017 [Armillaria ostoyae]